MLTPFGELVMWHLVIFLVITFTIGSIMVFNWVSQLTWEIIAKILLTIGIFGVLFLIEYGFYCLLCMRAS